MPSSAARSPSAGGTGGRGRGVRRAPEADLRKQSIESDLAEGILAHIQVPWTDTFREAETLAENYVEQLGIRSFDLLHVGLARVLKATDFLTFDSRQAQLAKAVGFKVTP
jgi:hypothetical protein